LRQELEASNSTAIKRASDSLIVGAQLLRMGDNGRWFFYAAAIRLLWASRDCGANLSLRTALSR
jgi:hypothetical protein